MIPDEAVVVARRAIEAAFPYDENNEYIVQLVLEAAAPHLMAPRKPKPGEGDYLPGWDDRKTLAELWQQHAPLPEGGLREGTYDALLAVATWGYQQRKDEDL